MVKDALNSVLDNIKERTTNPFLGTLIVVWLVKNWKLVYSLFYFDGSFKLQQRLNYINDYFGEHSFILNMIYVILITLAVLVLTYFLLALSRYISDSYELRILPLVSRWTDKSSIVLKSDYLEAKRQILELHTKVEEERLLRISSQSERDELLKQALPKKEDVDKEILEKLNDVFNPLFVDRDELLGVFEKIGQKGDLDDSDKVVKKLIMHDLIIYDKPSNEKTGYSKYSFTELGKQYVRYWMR